MKAKRMFVVCLLIVFMLLSFGIMASALEETTEAQILEARTIALNTPAMFGYTAEWNIVQETELYDFTDSIVAYCFDMQPTTLDLSTPATAYAIVNTDEHEFPIALFGVDGVSAYYGKSFEKAYYFGMLYSYIQCDESIIDPRTDEELNEDELEFFAQTSTLAISEDEIDEDYSSIRQMYLEGMIPYAEPITGSISNGASLQWRKGCAPTAIAMLIKTQYPGEDGNTLIDSLASYMGTVNKETDRSRIAPGISAYLSDRAMASPVKNTWNTTDNDGYPKTGLVYNPTSVFANSINKGFPVGIYCSKSNVVTAGYSGGIPGPHMMSGIGYSFGTSGNYVTCYTTSVRDGKVNFPVTSSGLTDHAWFLLQW